MRPLVAMSAALAIVVLCAGAAGFLLLLERGGAAAEASTPAEGSTPAEVSVPAGATPTRADPCPTGCINFAINVHDVGHVSESADTLLRLAGIFEKYGVKGEFYFTGPMVELYAEQRPDVIARLRSTGMAVSYHVRAPHPLVNGFEGPLRGLSDAALDATLRDYETFRLDRETGKLDRTRPGGYTLVKDTFGSAPLTVVAPNSDGRIKKAAFDVYRSMGARAAVWYHEEGASVERPLEVRQGMLVRPSDFSVTRWDPPGKGGTNFWWNGVLRNPGFDPVAYLQQRLADWSAPRGAFVTALVHENNFPRAGAEYWTYSYYTDEKKTTPLPPPWNITPPDVTRVRSQEEQAAIWAAYEALVAYAAEHLRVVTAADLVTLPR